MPLGYILRSVAGIKVIAVPPSGRRHGGIRVGSAAEAILGWAVVAWCGWLPWGLLDPAVFVVPWSAIKSTPDYSTTAFALTESRMYGSGHQARLTLVKSGMPPFRTPVRSLR